MKLLASLLGLGVSKLSPFSDDVLYTIDFVGEKAELDTPGIKYDESDFVIMKTPHNEEYKLGYSCEVNALEAENPSTFFR